MYEDGADEKSEGDEQLQASKRRSASRSLSPPTTSRPALGKPPTPAAPAMKRPVLQLLGC